MRIALLGAGRIGQLHGRLVSEQPDVDEVIVYDVIAGNAAKAAEAVNGRVVATAEEAIAAADAVIVAASTNMHAPLA
jgi:myo-inositol 2-dehydrogenase/D-chiro-inositol 1-dehydrogenase